MVAGTRTPNPLNEHTKKEQNEHLPSLQEAMPTIYEQPHAIRNQLEAALHRHAGHRVHHPEGGCGCSRPASASAPAAALNMAVDMVDEGLIDQTDRDPAGSNPTSSTSPSTRCSIRGRGLGGPVAKGLRPVRAASSARSSSPRTRPKPG